MLFLLCGPLPPPEAFSRDFFAGARVRLSRTVAASAVYPLARGLDVGIYTGISAIHGAFQPSLTTPRLRNYL